MDKTRKLGLLNERVPSVVKMTVVGLGKDEKGGMRWRVFPKDHCPIGYSAWGKMYK